jgi:hypothetical protein
MIGLKKDTPSHFSQKKGPFRSADIRAIVVAVLQFMSRFGPIAAIYHGQIVESGRFAQDPDPSQPTQRQLR